jgi:hypothetical protein
MAKGKKCSENQKKKYASHPIREMANKKRNAEKAKKSAKKKMKTPRGTARALRRSANRA